jgi:hypothetical protein
MMTRTISQISAIALGVAALVSLSPLSMARADPPATPASSAPTPAPAPSPTPTPSAAAPSLSEPAPTPAWAEAGPPGTTGAQHAAIRHPHRHYAYRNGHRYYSDNPVATAATGVAGGIADLGSIAAYPFYCFPNYGSCSVRMPYRY